MEPKSWYVAINITQRVWPSVSVRQNEQFLSFELQSDEKSTFKVIIATMKKSLEEFRSYQ